MLGLFPGTASPPEQSNKLERYKQSVTTNWLTNINARTRCDGACASTETPSRTPKMRLINVVFLGTLSEIKLKRTDTTLDLSQNRKCRSFAVTTIQSCATAVAAIIMSRPLRGRPEAVPSAISLAHTSAAGTSKGKTRPRNKPSGPVGPVNHECSSCRRRPGALSKTPRHSSATVKVEIKRSSLAWLSSHEATAELGCGLRVSLTIFVSSR
jgi:hypothetical protein